MVLVAHSRFAVVTELLQGRMGCPESRAYEMGGPLQAQHWLEALGRPEYSWLGHPVQIGAYARDGRVQQMAWLRRIASDHQLAQKAVNCRATVVEVVPAVLYRNETCYHWLVYYCPHDHKKFLVQTARLAKEATRD